MQNDFIEFIDIKLQSAEQTRLRVKEVLDRQYRKLFECQDITSLEVRVKSIVSTLEYAGLFDLIEYRVEKELMERVEKVYTSRSDELRKENK